MRHVLFHRFHSLIYNSFNSTKVTFLYFKSLLANCCLLRLLFILLYIFHAFKIVKLRTFIDLLLLRETRKCFLRWYINYQRLNFVNHSFFHWRFNNLRLSKRAPADVRQSLSSMTRNGLLLIIRYYAHIILRLRVHLSLINYNVWILDNTSIFLGKLQFLFFFFLVGNKCFPSFRIIPLFCN